MYAKVQLEAMGAREEASASLNVNFIRSLLRVPHLATRQERVTNDKALPILDVHDGRTLPSITDETFHLVHCVDPWTWVGITTVS